MYKGFRYIDNDSHILEPSDLWERYLEPEFRAGAPRTISRWDRPSDLGLTESADRIVFHQETHIGGHSFPHFDTGTPQRGVFQMAGVADVYEEYLGDGEYQGLFPPGCYKTVLDRSGIDRMVLYPTAGLTMNAVPELDPAQAAAHCRAYNRWLSDFVSEADDRILPAGIVDLRDPTMAAAEARKCVKDLGFKAIQINPEPVRDYPPLFDSFFEPLWAEIEDLNVPLGIHMAPITKFHAGSYYFPSWAMGIGITGFIIGNMMTSVALIVGGVLERHPKLRAVHLETGCGWVATWLDRMESGVLGSGRGRRPPELQLRPVEYFQRQCFASADPDDPGIKPMVEAMGDDSTVTAVDFGHPEGKGYVHAIEDTLGIQGVSDESKRKIMWDNGARLYGLGED